MISANRGRLYWNCRLSTMIVLHDRSALQRFFAASDTNDSAWEGGGTKRKLKLTIIAAACNGYKYPGVFFSIRLNPIPPTRGLKDPVRYVLDLEFVMS